VTITATDLFCGAGGSSLGARDAGVELRMAANHWERAIEVHQSHFPDAGHDQADISQADPRRYPRTDVLMASPECTNHSQARGVSRKRQDPSLWDAPDPSAERSRATMWDVPRFAEQMLYDVIVVENVVEASKWLLWDAWHKAMADLGYEHRVISTNSMYHRVPQSRDRIFVVFWRKGIRIDLDLEQEGWCARCERARRCVQAWKNGRKIGRYRQQWIWRCTECNHEAQPATLGAETILDWALPCPRIGDRTRPLAPATRARILAGLERYGWVPVITAGAGNTFETTPGNRAKPLTDPLPVQQASATHALATPAGFVMTNQPHNVPRAVEEPLATATTGNRHTLVVPMRANGRARPASEPAPTVAAGGNHHGLLMRNQTGGAEMVTPTDEPVRTLTTKGHQSLLMPYYGKGQTQPIDLPVPTVPTRDRFALIDTERLVDDCGFRMLEPHEIAAAMDFPEGYIPLDLPKKDRVKLAGNAVTASVMEDIMLRVVAGLGA
jgi:DNA (cytosine-5)-methyltransferase 1